MVLKYWYADHNIMGPPTRMVPSSAPALPTVATPATQPMIAPGSPANSAETAAEMVPTAIAPATQPTVTPIRAPTTAPIRLEMVARLPNAESSCWSRGLKDSSTNFGSMSFGATCDTGFKFASVAAEIG